MQHWHAIYTQPNREVIVNRQLESRDLEVYFPVLQFDRGYGRGVRIEPFFPHYLFVKVDLMAASAYGLRWLAGVRSIVETENEPIIIPESVIDTLRQRLEPATKRVMHKHEWLFRPGQKVVITSGPFKGFEAVFQHGLNGDQRVQILINSMSSALRLQVNVEQLEIAAN